MKNLTNKNKIPKEIILKKRYQFLFIQNFGKKIKSDSIILFIILKKYSKNQKIGFTITKKIGKAHIRNLIKRRLKHIARENFSCWKNYQIVILAKTYSSKASFNKLKFDFIKSIKIAQKIIKIN